MIPKVVLGVKLNLSASLHALYRGRAGRTPKTFPDLRSFFENQ